jgi:hypothetical protein
MPGISFIFSVKLRINGNWEEVVLLTEKPSSRFFHSTGELGGIIRWLLNKYPVKCKPTTIPLERMTRSNKK